MATSTQDWIEELKGISVLELAERIKALEEEFGVSAAAVAAKALTGAPADTVGRARVTTSTESANSSTAGIAANKAISIPRRDFGGAGMGTAIAGLDAGAAMEAEDIEAAAIGPGVAPA